MPRAAPPGPPWGALSSPQRRRAPLPPEGLSMGGVGGGAGLRFPPRWIRDRAIKGRVVTKPSLYLKTNSCNEGQNFSIYIPFYKISFYKSWLLSLQKGWFLASLSHFWLQPSLQRTCNEHRIFCKLYEQIVARLRPIWFYTNRTKPRCPDFVALQGLVPRKNPLHLYPESPQKLHPNVQPKPPRHGLTAEYFSWSKPKETTKADLPTISKWQIGLFLWQKVARRDAQRARKGR